MNLENLKKLWKLKQFAYADVFIWNLENLKKLWKLITISDSIGFNFHNFFKFSKFLP